jgi:hypothetical protein
MMMREVPNAIGQNQEYYDQQFESLSFRHGSSSLLQMVCL